MAGRATPNNFDALRISAASAVLYSHHHALTGQFEPLVLGIHTLGGLAVLVFFTISGHLVTASWLADPNILRFCARRALRIWPAYTAVLALSAFVLGPWVSDLPVDQYLRDPLTWSYLGNIWMAAQNSLPGVFTGNPLPDAVNGSLWTIPLEIQCYLLLAAAGLFGLLKSRTLWLAILAAIMLWYQIRFGPDFHADWQLRREMLLYFAAGSAICVLQRLWIDRRWQVGLGLGCLAAVLWLADCKYLAFTVIVPYAVIAFGVSTTPFVRRAGRWGDPSYGIYLLAFPVQQAVIQFLWPALGFAGTFALALFVTVALAYLSWHGVEKSALRMKPRRQPGPASGRPLKSVTAIAIQAFKRQRHLLGWLWLAWILVAALNQLTRYFPAPGAALNSDATWTYLPNARKLLAQPWTFLTTDPSSYHVAPMGYVWAAVWGADPVRIQLANCVLFLGCVLLMWRCATRLGGFWAGVVATALLVYFPQLTSYVPQVLTETPYLFGLLLGTTAFVEYALGNPRPRLMLGLAATGLAMTLLARPVLQLFTLLGLFATLAWMGHRSWQAKRATGRTTPQPSPIVNAGLCAALVAALSLPAAVVVKNGLCFDFWALGTGAGTGLYYGVSPFKMGLEPVYSGFNYDAGLTPLAADPRTQGHPLSKQSDAINARVALSIIENTTVADNLKFFAGKLKAWAFYSTPELRMYPKLRAFRLFEWLSISLAALTLLWRTRASMVRMPVALPGAQAPNRTKLCVLAALLALVLGMAAQLTPVLYNTRYNLYFLEPWLMLLCGAGVAVLLQWRSAEAGTWHTMLAQGVRKVLIILMLALLPIALARYASRHEVLTMDPYRPGPVSLLLDGDDMGVARMTGAVPLAPRRWRIESKPALLQIPVNTPDALALAPDRVMDAIWRLRLGVATPQGASACTSAILAYAPAHAPVDWYEPQPVLALRSDGGLHTYAIHGNDNLRPAGDGTLSVTLSCAPGTVVTWAGAELLRSAVPEAARALIREGKAIDPYLRRDPH